MSILLKKLNQRPIAMYPLYIDIAGSASAGIVLSQLMYWFSQKDKIFKTNEEISKETRLSIDEVKSAKKKIKSLAFIEVLLEGLPAKTYYKIDWELYEKTLYTFCEAQETTVGGNPTNLLEEESNTAPTSTGKSHQPVGGNPTNLIVEIPPTINVIQKTTTETTTKNTLSPKSSLKKIPKNKMSEDEGGGDKNFLSFVNRIRKAYVPKPELNIFPPILKIKNGEGKFGAFKIDAKGHLYVSFPGKIQDLSPTEADEYWRFIYANQNQLITHPAKEVTCDISNSG